MYARRKEKFSNQNDNYQKRVRVRAVCYEDVTRKVETVPVESGLNEAVCCR